ncbi:MAG: DUF485 domain-containing protein [Candidatus Binatia bacterium]|nr:DUF485 domain-containing protein [Candidatus Binatia bacterium]
MDLTPSTGAAPDVASFEQDAVTPPHARTGEEHGAVVDWERVAAMDEFRALVKAKLRFIVPATIFFVVYYFALPVLVGYAPGLMERKVIGVVNLAYLFALSQFFMAWGLAALYLRAAGRFDTMAARLIATLRGQRQEER